MVILALVKTGSMSLMQAALLGEKIGWICVEYVSKLNTHIVYDSVILDWR